MSEWRLAEDFDGIEVSSLGEVRWVNGKLLAQCKNSKGYWTVRPVKGSRSSTLVHRLVAKAFIPNPAGLPFVNHLDGIKTNAAAANLEWVDDAANKRHAWRIGLRTREHVPMPTGEQNPRAILTEAQVMAIRAEGKKVRRDEQARRYGVTVSAIKDVRCGRRWRHLLPEPPK